MGRGSGRCTTDHRKAAEGYEESVAAQLKSRIRPSLLVRLASLDTRGERVRAPPPEDAARRWPRTTFVDGVDAAITEARQIAGDQDVNIASPTITRQAFDLGLVDEVCVSLVPVLFGEGIPYFAELDRGHLLLDDPIVLQGRRALHLRYPVRR